MSMSEKKNQWISQQQSPHRHRQSLHQLSLIQAKPEQRLIYYQFKLDTFVERLQLNFKYIFSAENKEIKL